MLVHVGEVPLDPAVEEVDCFLVKSVVCVGVVLRRFALPEVDMDG